jgi:membrane-bound lytic murein transglycosylase B
MMDRRSFLVLAAAGLADPMQGVQPVALQNRAPIPYTALNSGGGAEAGAVPGFDDWLSGFRARLLLDGWPSELVDRELTGLTADPRVVAADGRQPEFSKPISDYVKGVISDARVREGQGFAQSLAFLPAVEARFGVPREILLSIWAVESQFGRIQGDMDVLRCMATLAAEGRRREFAESQLRAALQIIATGEATRATLRGSWAGAMGQTQFIPTSYLSAAVDQDGDSRRDIWASRADALASAANLLAKGGWMREVGWAREVILPVGFDHGLSEGPREVPAWWEARGVRLADGRGWSAADRAAPAGLILPSGAAGPAYLALPNHFAIRTYNNATAYALAVGLLADRFAGRNGPVTPWPVETPLSLADRTAAQDALRKLGFDPGGTDGVIGAQTRASLRAWQKARGHAADGYLSIEAVRALTTEAGAV